MPTPPEALIGVKLVAAMPKVSEAVLIAVDVDNGVVAVVTMTDVDASEEPAEFIAFKKT